MSGSVSALSHRGTPSSLTTAADALHEAEVEDARAFIRIGWIVAAVAFGMVFAVPGNRQLALAIAGLIAVGSAYSVWLYRALPSSPRLATSGLTVLAITSFMTGQLGIHYVGLLSAAFLINVVGIYYFCRTENTVAAIGMYLFAAIMFGVEGVLVFADKIPDPGFFHVRTDALAPRIVAYATLQSAYLAAFITARLGRQAQLEALDRLQEATRLATQREEQVAELRQDLDRALQVGGPGRFTGHILGNWELGVILGRGAMGEVYEATHTGDGAAAAVKVLRREWLGTQEAVLRFLRETRVASGFASPHVVRVLGASQPEDPIPFLAMERLHGTTLHEQLRAGKPLAQERTAQLVDNVCEVLEEARAASIVHRDVKPHNLMLTDDGAWKVLDFGIAYLGDAAASITQGNAIGTPAYMAPEQARGDAIDHRADVYGLAAVLYRCWTGVAAFHASDTPTLLYAVVHAMPLRPSAIAPVPGDIEYVLRIGLAKSPNARFQTAAELAAAYHQAERGELDEALRQRARTLLRQRPWVEPVTEVTQRLS